MYLACHSYYSLRYGTIAPEDLPRLAKTMGIEALCMADINNTSEAFGFISACKKEAVKPVCGIDFRAVDPETKQQEFRYLAIAQNSEGWYELCKHLTEHSVALHNLPALAPDWKHCHVVYRKLVKPIEEFQEHE